MIQMKHILRKTLYSRNQTGKVVQWTIEVHNHGDYSSITVISGLHNGSKSARASKIAEGKNIGKSNETTHETQAIAEAESRVRKKLAEGYVEIENPINIEQVVPHNKQDRSGLIKPMLAQKFKVGKFKYPALIQRKYNGVRVTVHFDIIQDGLFGDKLICNIVSREGVAYNGINHIKEGLIRAVEQCGINVENLIIDGEIYAHGMYLQDLRSAATKINERSPALTLRAFDICSDEPQIDRIGRLHDLCNMFNRCTQVIKFVETIKVHNDNEAQHLSLEFIEQGFEGGILRDMDAPYQDGKRSKYLVKIKKVKLDKFMVVDIIETDKDHYRGEPIGLFVCQNDISSHQFKVTPTASKKERREMLINKHKIIGSHINVTYYERTKDGLPFHANGVII
jgi:DNA ligase 1